MTYLKSRPPITQPDNLSIRLIPLTRGQVCIVDADRYESVMQWNWYAKYYSRARSFYAARGVGGEKSKSVFLHRQLIGEPDEQVDHINGDTLDCRIQNLRAATCQQNNANRGPLSNNTSGVAGVIRDRNKWRARIIVSGKELNLGTFDSKDDAIAARVYAELIHFGEFAPAARDLLILPLCLTGPPVQAAAQ